MTDPAPPDFIRARIGSVLALTFLILAIAGGFMAVEYGWVPNNWIPWRAPRLDEKPTSLAHLQLMRLSRDPAICTAVVTRARQLTFRPLADRKIDGDCAYHNAVQLRRTPIPLANPPMMACPLAAALYWWEADVNRAAEEILHTGVRRIEHVGVFACRNVNSAETGPRSEHATANAIDITAFELDNGRTIAVLKDWNTGSPEAAFLTAVHDAACRYFNGVLGPNYNRLHASHFHLDMGPYLMCR